VRRGGALALILLAAAAVVVPEAPAAASGVASPDPEDAWREAARAGERLFDAQDHTLLGDGAAAERSVRAARRATTAALAAGLADADPGAARAARGAVAGAARAATAGDVVAVAAARGRARAALVRASATAVIAAAGRGDARAASDFLLLRDFRTATRFTRPGVDATRAIDGLAARRVRPAAARLAVAKDLLDAYQAKLREAMDDAAEAAGRRFRPRAAAASAQAAGYWAILRDRYRQDLGAAALARADDAFAAYARAGRGPDGAAPLAAARRRVDGALRGFVAAPFTPAEEARRAQQLLRFVDLVPVEYGRGVKGRRVTLDFEVAEAAGFRDGAAAAFSDLEAKLARRDRARTATAAAALAQLKAIVATAQRTGEAAPAPEVEALAERATGALTATFPASWKQRTDDADLDLVDVTLDRLDAAVSSGQWHLAEQARLEAYAFIEFGPELKLRSFDPGLAFDIEGLVWFGARGERGLAELIARRASRDEFRATRLALDETLRNARATLGEGQSRLTVVTNAAILVFREGLEAVLILAAITASMVGGLAGRRRPVMIGAALGLVASVITWMLAQLVLESLSGYGEKLEAVVGLTAIAVLLLVMNWFFHKVYWTEHIRKFHKRRKKLIGETDAGARAGFWSAQVLGFGLLGLTSVYREGFETVLFLQSLELATDAATVVEGALLGLALTGIVALVTFKLQRKLPYKRMLIVTGLLLAFVLVVMVGTTARTLQGIGWLPITPIDVQLPYWAGTWLGVFPTWESLGAQVAALVIVFGSYVLAEELRVKRPRRRASRSRSAAPVAER
jgi:high-affinity iron transporter